MNKKKENTETPKSLTLNKETVDVLVANVIPTTKYFELRFDNMQEQINRIEKQNDKLREDMDNRFAEFKQDVDKRFEQVDKRFEQVDKRFEQIDIRLNQIIQSIDGLSNKLDYRDGEQRSFTIKMFTISITVSIMGIFGVLLKLAGLF